MLEVLVVLIITSLISGILFEALAQVYSVRVRLGRSMEQMEEYLLVDNAVRKILVSLYPGEEGGDDTFRAGARTLSGLTLSPMSTPLGMPTPFELKLEAGRGPGATALVYVDRDGRELMITEWPRSSARFSFWSADAGWQDVWPPALGTPPQLPDIVQLSVIQDGEEWAVTAAMKTIAVQPPRIEDLLGISR